MPMVNSDHEARRKLPIASAPRMQVMNGGTVHVEAGGFYALLSGLIVLGRRP